jgi:hypothetical protein
MTELQSHKLSYSEAKGHLDSHHLLFHGVCISAVKWLSLIETFVLNVRFVLKSGHHSIFSSGGHHQAPGGWPRARSHSTDFAPHGAVHSLIA